MLTTNKLYFNYPTSPSVLKSINLELKPGNIYGLFGKNGEGKSTLIKIMSGLLFPKSGSCTFNGLSTQQREPQTLRDIFLIPEEFELPRISIKAFELINSVFYPNFSKEQFYHLLEEFHLKPQQIISNLSFGQKKKVLIAFGIAVNTQLLLMDEPTNGLDIPSKSQFRKVMAASVDSGKCMVISTHQVRDLHSLINHVIILDNAQLIFDQSLDQVTKMLWFGRASSTEQTGLIYSEGAFGGRSVHVRMDREETEVDLELLFNGVLNEPARINQIMQNNDHGAGV